MEKIDFLYFPSLNLKNIDILGQIIPFLSPQPHFYTHNSQSSFLLVFEQCDSLQQVISDPVDVRNDYQQGTCLVLKPFVLQIF